MRPRVAVTGVGVSCALGAGAEAVWAALLAGCDGTGPIRHFDATRHRVRIAAECAELLSETALSREPLLEAWRASGHGGGKPPRTGLALGLLGSETRVFERGMFAAPDDRGAGLTRDTVRWYAPDAIARRLATELGIEGPVATLANACSAGNHAIASGCEWLRAGRVDAVVAGGMGVVSFTGFSHFDHLRALAPERCQPFDAQRRGLVLGDGAGWLVLEAWDAARRRGAPILAEVLGYGISCDAHNVATPHPQARGAIAAMRDALSDARLEPDAIDYVSAHGTGTRMNDPVETLAMHTVFGARGGRLPCSSVKSMIGHTLGGSSAIESVVCCLAIRDGIVPPTIHYETPDPDCALDCVPNQARELEVRHALNNAFAFGGNNCAVVFGAAS